jgi:hypothetical protein
VPSKPKPHRKAPRIPNRPAADHPWRQPIIAQGQPKKYRG